MKTPNWKDETICVRDGFTVVLSFSEEIECPKRHFIDCCGWTEDDYRSIRDFYWFNAEIQAFKGRTLCATSYLGANAYRNKKEVMANGHIEDMLSGYMPQEIEEVIEEAHAELARLIAETQERLDELAA